MVTIYFMFMMLWYIIHLTSSSFNSLHDYWVLFGTHKHYLYYSQKKNGSHYLKIVDIIHQDF